MKPVEPFPEGYLGVRFHEMDGVRRRLDLRNLDSHLSSVPCGVAFSRHMISSDLTFSERWG